MDINDLLHTNEFITNDNLNEKSHNFNSLEKYLYQHNKPSQKYLQNNMFENNPINIQQTLSKKWPAMLNKNDYPTFDNFTNGNFSKVYINKY